MPSNQIYQCCNLSRIIHCHITLQQSIGHIDIRVIRHDDRFQYRSCFWRALLTVSTEQQLRLYNQCITVGRINGQCILDSRYTLRVLLKFQIALSHKTPHIYIKRLDHGKLFQYFTAEVIPVVHLEDDIHLVQQCSQIVGLSAQHINTVNKPFNLTYGRSGISQLDDLLIIHIVKTLHNAIQQPAGLLTLWVQSPQTQDIHYQRLLCRIVEQVAVAHVITVRLVVYSPAIGQRHAVRIIPRSIEQHLQTNVVIIVITRIIIYGNKVVLIEKRHVFPIRQRLLKPLIQPFGLLFFWIFLHNI